MSNSFPAQDFPGEPAHLKKIVFYRESASSLDEGTLTNSEHISTDPLNSLASVAVGRQFKHLSACYFLDRLRWGGTKKEGGVFHDVCSTKMPRYWGKRVCGTAAF